jgi:hypothetical protein
MLDVNELDPVPQVLCLRVFQFLAFPMYSTLAISHWDTVLAFRV